MREMKDSGIEWIGNIPNYWKCCKQKYVIQLINGRAYSDNEFEENGKYRILRVGNLFSNPTWYSSSLELPDDKYCDKGDLLYSWSMSYAPVIWQGEKVIYHYHIWKTSLGKELYKTFAYYYLLSLTDALRSEIHETTMGFITMGIMNTSYIVYPDISEQQFIADFLDHKCSEIDSLIADVQKQIEILEEYKRSLVFNVISRGTRNVALKGTTSDVWTKIPEDWRLVDVKYVFEIVKRIAGQEGFDVLSVTQKGLKFKDIESNNGQQAESYSGYQFVYPTDYVMNHMDLLTGWVDCSTMFGVTSPDYRVFRLRDKENNDPTYFKYIMQCCYMSRIFYSLGQGVSNLGRWRLQTSAFNNFMIPVPPLEEQQQIAEYLDKKCTEIDSIISEKQQQIETIEEYKKSLIFEFVTGKKEVPHINVIIDHKTLLAYIMHITKGKLKGKIQLQKIMYLCEIYLGIDLNTVYHRAKHGPYDYNLDSYLNEINNLKWYNIPVNGNPMIPSYGEKYSEFEEKYISTLSKYELDIKKITSFIIPMKTSESERVATLYASWNDMIIDGNKNPSFEEIHNDVINNWTPNKGNFKKETWKDTYDKMLESGIVPKGNGLHTEH